MQESPEGKELRLELSDVVLDPERAPDETPAFDRPLPKDVEVIERQVPPAADHR